MLEENNNVIFSEKSSENSENLDGDVTPDLKEIGMHIKK